MKKRIKYKRTFAACNQIIVVRTKINCTKHQKITTTPSKNLMRQTVLRRKTHISPMQISSLDLRNRWTDQLALLSFINRWKHPQALDTGIRKSKIAISF